MQPMAIFVSFTNNCFQSCRSIAKVSESLADRWLNCIFVTYEFWAIMPFKLILVYRMVVLAENIHQIMQSSEWLMKHSKSFGIFRKYSETINLHENAFTTVSITAMHDNLYICIDSSNNKITAVASALPHSCFPAGTNIFD